MPTLTKFAAPFFVQTFAKEIFKSDYESYEGLLRVVIHNRFKFSSKTLSYDKNINSRGAIPTRTEK